MKNNKTNNEHGKLPPQATEVEEAVLGSLMLERDAYTSISALIDTSSFYKGEHRIIFETISSLAKNNNPIDLITVTQELKDNGQLEEVGGPRYITQLTRRVASAAHIEHHARIIAQKYIQRELIRGATELLEKAYDDTNDVEQLIVDWNKLGDALENSSNIADSGTTIDEVLKKTVLEIEADCANARNNKTPGITTGLPSLNINTGGWRGGNLIVLAARPGVGKTSFALFFVLEAAKAGYWVNIFSFEMNKEDLARIILASESGVCRSNVRDGELNTLEWQRLNQAIAQLEKLPIIFHDASGMNVSQVQATIRKNHKNGRCDFAIVDYLQLVKSSNNKQIRELEVSEISRTLKATALNENIPIMALSQLNRAADGVMPKLSHLRESGAIEQDADLVIFLHHSDAELRIIRFIVAKHRRGQTGDIEIIANEDMTSFAESEIISTNY